MLIRQCLYLAKYKIFLVNFVDFLLDLLYYVVVGQIDALKTAILRACRTSCINLNILECKSAQEWSEINITFRVLI